MLYNFLLLIYLIIYAPKVLFEYFFLKKKKTDLLKRIGIKKYTFQSYNKRPVIWIHAVSLGETKAAVSLVERLKEEYPHSCIIISNTTQTGHDAAKRFLQGLADQFVFFPIDFSFIVKRLFVQIQPNLVIFIETDLWFNFIKEAKKKNAKVIVVSAKISQRSHWGFCQFASFAKRLFSLIDLILPQNDIYKQRFASFVTEGKLKICGNLKLVNNIKKDSIDCLRQWRHRLGLNDSFILTIASTHEPEEVLILNKIKDIPNIKILIAPRHPERFDRVFNQVKKITCCSLLSNLSDKNVNVIIIDQMGSLNILYQLSDLAILGGSYVNRVGGHNILEPVFVNTPVFFGPFMHAQLELKKIILESQCGKQVDLNDIKSEVLKYIADRFLKENLKNNCCQVNKFSKHILQNTFDNIKNLISN